MACAPFAVAFSEPERPPEPSALLQQLTARTYSPAELALLEALSGSGSPRAQQTLASGALHVPGLELGGQVQEPSTRTAPAAASEDRLRDVVRQHAMSSGSQDLPSCVLRGEAPRSYVGLWPAAALIPHSCAPNTNDYVIADTLFVRATSSLQPGECITRNYLGPSVFAPLATRRALLQSGWGLHCTCPRCVAEESSEGVHTAIQGAYDESQRLSDAWTSAAESGDAGGAAAVQSQLAASAVAVESALRAASLPYELEVSVAAGTIALSTLVFNIRAAAGEMDVEAKETELCYLEALAPGTDAHLYTALHHYVQVLLTYGEPSLEEERAQERVNNAHVTRYGRLQHEVLAQLSEIRFADVVPMYAQAEGEGAEA